MSLNARSHLGQTWVKPLSVMAPLNIYLCPTAHVSVLDIANDTLKQLYNRIYQMDSFVYLITVHSWDCLEQNSQHTANSPAPLEIKSVCALSCKKVSTLRDKICLCLKLLKPITGVCYMSVAMMCPGKNSERITGKKYLLGLCN